MTLAVRLQTLISTQNSIIRAGRTYELADLVLVTVTDENSDPVSSEPMCNESVNRQVSRVRYIGAPFVKLLFPVLNQRYWADNQNFPDPNKKWSV